MKKISIVVPVYFNEPNLPDTVPRLLALKDKLAQSLELIFVDDGSGDKSLPILLDFRSRYPEIVKVVKLSRNFGSMAAIQAGLKVAQGDCVGMTTADLQDPPELFLDMIGHWEKGIKAVLAVRSNREESMAKKFFANTYYALIRRFAIPNYPAGGFDFFLVDRQVVDDIVSMNEKNTNLMSLIFWLGYPHVTIPYVRRRREKGRSRWTLAKKIKLFVDSFVAFSYVPIRFLSFVGVTVALASFAYGAFVVFQWFFTGIAVKGFAALAVFLSLASGVQMTMLGIVGEYLWRTLEETRKRPNYVIDEVYSAERSNNGKESVLSTSSSHR